VHYIAFADRACSAAGDKPRSYALCVKLVAARQAHHPAYSVDILFETNDTLLLAATIPTPPFCETSISFFLLG